MREVATLSKIERAVEVWGSLPRLGKFAAGGAAIFSACMLCAIFGMLLPDTAVDEAGQDEAIGTAVAQALLEVHLTQSTTIQETPVPTTVQLTSTSTVQTFPINVHSCIPASEYEIGVVTDVVDGDTIRVDVNGQNYSVRYIGIDAPDSPVSTPSEALHSGLVSNKEVLLFGDVSNVDSFGRLLRYVYADDTFINLELVRQGSAVAVSYPPDDSCDDALAQAQTAAVAERAGMWAPTPTSPPSQSGAQLVIVAVNKQSEYVDVQNKGDAAQDLSGWYLVSERGNQTCWLSGSIGPGETLRIWAMSSTEGGFSCGFGTNIWNNSEHDPAVLYNAMGNEVSRYP